MGNVRGAFSIGQRVLTHLHCLTEEDIVIRVLLAGVGDGCSARLLCCCDGRGWVPRSSVVLL